MLKILQNINLKKWILVLTLIAILSLVFLAGVFIGVKRYQPVIRLIELKSWLMPININTTGERQLMESIFRDPVIASHKLYPSIKNIQGIQEANNKIFIPVRLFESAYENIEIKTWKYLDLDRGATSLLCVDFELGGRNYQAYAYALRKIEKRGLRRSAVLIIPGTGINNSTEILNNDISSYSHGALDAFDSVQDAFIFIKPNEDVLAFHNGDKKLGVDVISNYHLNRGGSYSASYIVQALAVQKVLKRSYEETILAGLSQGGLASLLILLQAEPDIAIISSGYSILNNVIEWSNADQILIPGYDFSALYNGSKLVARLRDRRTDLLFTWGKNEAGIYRIEARNAISCSLLKRAPNVSCAMHEKGHSFPVREIRDFLRGRREKVRQLQRNTGAPDQKMAAQTMPARGMNVEAPYDVKKTSNCAHEDRQSCAE